MLGKVLVQLLLLPIFVISVFAQVAEKFETLKGTIKDNSGVSISNVNVTLTGSSGLVLRSSVDEEGRFEIVLPIGKYRVEFLPPKGFDGKIFEGLNVKAKSFGKHKFDVVLLRNAEYVQILQFRCESIAKSDEVECSYLHDFGATFLVKLKGWVSDYRSRRVQDVQVRGFDGNGRIFSTYTNKNGFFGLMLPKGNYSIEFRKKGLARHRYENVEVNITDAYPRERELNVTLYHALKEIIND